MAETLTVNTTPETVTVGENLTADEQDSLAVGEELVKQQDQLLAGKYKDASELEKAYIELQKKLGQSESTTDTAEPQQEYDLYTEDGAVNYETANVVYGEKLGITFKAPNLY